MHRLHSGVHSCRRGIPRPGTDGNQILCLQLFMTEGISHQLASGFVTFKTCFLFSSTYFWCQASQDMVIACLRPSHMFVVTSHVQFHVQTHKRGELGKKRGQFPCTFLGGADLTDHLDSLVEAAQRVLGRRTAPWLLCPRRLPPDPYRDPHPQEQDLHSGIRSSLSTWAP